MKRFDVIRHALRNQAVDFLATVPSPPQLIFQLDTFSTGERARVRGRIHYFLVHHINARSAPSSGLSATFSPLLGGNGVDLSYPPDPVSVEARLVSYTASPETDLLPPRFLLAFGEQKTGREERKRILSPM